MLWLRIMVMEELFLKIQSLIILLIRISSILGSNIIIKQYIKSNNRPYYRKKSSNLQEICMQQRNKRKKGNVFLKTSFDTSILDPYVKYHPKE